MKLALVIALGVTVLVLLFGSIWYVPFRLSRLMGLTRRWPLFVAAATALLAYPILMGTRAADADGMMPVAVVASLLLGLHINLTLLLLARDAIGLAVPLSGKLSAMVVLGAALMVSLVGGWRAQTFSVTEAEMPVEGLARDVTLMHISDVHIGPVRGRDYLERVVRETNSRQPDLVLINGDLVDGSSAVTSGALEALGGFDAPVFFTLGNHESYVPTEAVLGAVAAQGVRILRNEAVRTHGLQLIGLDYMRADEHTYDAHSVNRQTIRDELSRIAPSDSLPSVLMHHSPVGFEYAIEHGISLMLSGHTHGGQVFPATAVTPFMFPLSRGVEQIGGTWFLVSQGVGTFGPRMRILSSNEVNLIRLRAVPRAAG